MYIFNINNTSYVTKYIMFIYNLKKCKYIIIFFYFLKATIKFKKYTDQRKQSLVFNFQYAKQLPKHVLTEKNS